MDFQIVKNLSFTKEYEKLDDVRRKDYIPYLVNRAFSHFPDSVLQANAMNMRSHIDIQSQFDYYFYALRKRKRFAQWNKKSDMKMIKLIMDAFDCSSKEAQMYADVLNESELTEFEQMYGG